MQVEQQVEMQVEMRAWQFLDHVSQDPQWALNIPKDTVVRIKEFLIVENSKIGGLGPNIIFEGISIKDGCCVEFKNCPNLLKVDSTFLGPVKFVDCGLKTTQGIKIDKYTCAGFKKVATFYNCQNLKEATGKWSGPVDYTGSGITKVHNLTIEVPNQDGEAAWFDGCQELSEIKGPFPGMISACFCPKLIDTKNLIVLAPNKNGTAAAFRNSSSLKKAQGRYHGFVDYKECPIQIVDPKELIVTATSKEGLAASFWGCPEIKLATGEWIGTLDFSQSHLASTKGLIILNPNDKGVAALFRSVQDLEIAEGTFHGMPDYSNSSIQKAGKIKIIPPKNLKIWANFDNCRGLLSLPTNIPLENLRAPKELLNKALRVHTLGSILEGVKKGNKSNSEEKTMEI